jgi:hypothetical protein
MATLVSPGVSISVSDESFYAPAGTGTVPLIVIATAQDKSSPDGSGTAGYTTSATAGKLYKISSQRELLQTYGNPTFKSSGGTQLHGDETNEYGLLAAYSFLGVANSAYVLRANVDLDALAPSATAPTTAPADGSYWLDTASTVIGIKIHDGTNWVNKTALVPEASDIESTGKPKIAFGKKDDFAVVYVNNSGVTQAIFKVYHKTSNSDWDLIGSTDWNTNTSSAYHKIGYNYQLPLTRSGGGALQSGDVFVAMNEPNNGSTFALKLYSASSSQFASVPVFAVKTMSEAYAVSRHGATPELGDIVIDVAGEGTNANDGQATFELKRHNGNSSVIAESSANVSVIDLSSHIGATVSMYMRVNDGANIAVQFRTDGDADGNASVDDLVTDINSAISNANAQLSFSANVIAVNNNGKIKITNSDNKDVLLWDGNVAGFGPADLNLTSDDPYSNFKPLSFTAKSTAITGTLADGTLWYDSVVSKDNLDILENDSTNGWQTFSGDIQVKASTPTKKADGVSSLAEGDLWIDGSKLEDYPAIYKYSVSQVGWVLVDSADQDSPDGVVFGDFRSSTAGSIFSTAPSSATSPVGILGWNKSLSGGNVKKWNATLGYWQDASGNKSDGSPYMLRKAQRQMIVKQLQSALTSNQDIRNETNRFNIVAVPGYPELADEMIALGVDRKNTVFSVIDSPFRLASDATSTSAWANNSNLAGENGEDGLLASDPYAAVYYPHGISTNLDGSSVFVPASHMALRTIAFNDQVAFPWFAPAGFQRGLVSNASNTGYIDGATGEFVPVALNEGQRDSLYSDKVNPIGNFPGRGIAVFGQKTLNPTSSALDRVNVARLVVYLREQLDDAVKPFLFEPNDEVTRANAKVVVDRLLGELVSQRGLFDFITVCDTSNNTPARIDRNELHIDIAIQPVKAVEFIYIPIRIQNTLGSTA